MINQTLKAKGRPTVVVTGQQGTSWIVTPADDVGPPLVLDAEAAAAYGVTEARALADEQAGWRKLTPERLAEAHRAAVREHSQALTPEQALRAAADADDS